MRFDTAMIFAAGFGTRMGALTKDTPKPLLPLAGRPMIDHSIDLLRDAGVTRLFANTHYLADRLEPHLATRGVTPLREDPILETGGGLRAALGRLDRDPVITMNPDAVWRGANPVRALIDAWSEDMSALLVLAPAVVSEIGDFSLEHGEIRRSGPFLYSGLQILRTHRMDEIATDRFSLNAYWDLLMADGPVHGLVYDGSWTDIGTREALDAANRRAGP